MPDRDLITWEEVKDQFPYARLSVEVRKNDRETQLEIILQPRYVQYATNADLVPIQKHIKVNGISRRAFNYIGQLNMVMFSPRDIDLISGEPALRRRHLDMTNSQVNFEYLRALQRYNKVLERRNHLLRQIVDGHSRSHELEFWDQELIRLGSWMIFERFQTITRLSELSQPIHHEFTGSTETLEIRYQTNIDASVFEPGDIKEVEEKFSLALAGARERELARGLTTTGPHRDELRFLVNGIDMGSYGSRGQQRTIALAVKLSEVEFMLARTGEMPVLLLDDVLSELDRERREHILETVTGYQQVLMTTTDLDRFPEEFLSRASRFRVENGTIQPVGG